MYIGFAFKRGMTIAKANVKVSFSRPINSFGNQRMQRKLPICQILFSQTNKDDYPKT